MQLIIRSNYLQGEYYYYNIRLMTYLPEFDKISIDTRKNLAKPLQEGKKLILWWMGLHNCTIKIIQLYGKPYKRLYSIPCTSEIYHSTFAHFWKIYAKYNGRLFYFIGTTEPVSYVEVDNICNGNKNYNQRNLFNVQSSKFYAFKWFR